MSSTKKRDLAKELADFLLEEEKGKGATKSVKKSKSGEISSVDLSVEPGEEHKLASNHEHSKPSENTKATTIIKLENEPEFNFTALSDKPIDLEVPVSSGPKPDMTPPPLQIDFSVPAKPETKEDVLPQFPVNPPPDAQIPKVEIKFGEAASSSYRQNPKGSERSSGILNEVSQLVGGAEAVRVAQARIKMLEKECDQLRDETEKLLSASEGLQRSLAEMKSQQEQGERKHREKIEILEEEKIVLKSRLSARDQELSQLKAEKEELQLRFQNDLRKIRVRERELENRQELMKAETIAIVKTKDEMILELKRQLEQLHFELDNFRSKSADLSSTISEYYDRNHRTVKALRLALAVLESGDGDERKRDAG